MIRQKITFPLSTILIWCSTTLCGYGQEPHTDCNQTAPAACSAEATAVQPTASTAGKVPALKILRPKEGETFFDTPIVLQVMVENFQLEPPTPIFDKPNPNPVGHLHVFLDDYPEVATDSTQLMFGKKEAGKYLKKGKHTIAVEIVHDNHDVLEPRVWKRVDFYVDH
jgi:hypothetical protein